ncbi:hypothetical protein B0T17DRAFT_365611 [Bombardia bombarda]|uniref:Uncharacterized protein n=1 Tax=Bombardia bombarda TaxID=252184 RepID=A0AA39WIL1_9PEZI|nr:hypothetical protein B0T17DRAFT_365611 [Bombardia bombarda]
MCLAWYARSEDGNTEHGGRRDAHGGERAPRERPSPVVCRPPIDGRSFSMDGQARPPWPATHIIGRACAPVVWQRFWGCLAASDWLRAAVPAPLLGSSPPTISRFLVWSRKSKAERRNLEAPLLSLPAHWLEPILPLAIHRPATRLIQSRVVLFQLSTALPTLLHPPCLRLSLLALLCSRSRQLPSSCNKRSHLAFPIPPFLFSPFRLQHNIPFDCLTRYSPPTNTNTNTNSNNTNKHYSSIYSTSKHGLFDLTSPRPIVTPLVHSFPPLFIGQFQFFDPWFSSSQKLSVVVTT